MAEPAEGAKTDARRITSFPPVGDGRTRLLILGSLPGVISLRRGQYYGNPRNQFWRLAAEILGAEMPAAYEQRLATLIAAGVGLWDVVGSATRTGSLDADIRGHQPNPLADYVATLPSLKAVAFNGGAAWNIGRRQLAADPRLELIKLPSSSPAYTLPFETKVSAWRGLRDVIV